MTYHSRGMCAKSRLRFLWPTCASHGGVVGYGAQKKEKKNVDFFLLGQPPWAAAQRKTASAEVD